MNPARPGLLGSQNFQAQFDTQFLRCVVICTLQLPWKPPCLCVAGLPGVDAHIPKLSFSAALTVPMERAGTIVFDKIFVNEGEFYDPTTGEAQQ